MTDYRHMQQLAGEISSEMDQVIGHKGRQPSKELFDRRNLLSELMAKIEIEDIPAELRLEFRNHREGLRRFSSLSSGRYGEYDQLAKGLEGLFSRMIPAIQASSTTQESTRNFEFIHDTRLREIVYSNYQELEQDMRSSAWISALAMAGSVLEGILYDALLSNDANRQAVIASLKNKKEVRRQFEEGKWMLDDLIRHAAKQNLITGDHERLADGVVRNFRNCIHPMRVKDSPVRFSDAEARGAHAAVDSICDAIRQSHEKARPPP